MEVRPRVIKKFETVSGICPFDEWLGGLDINTQMIIDSRLLRLRLGNLGKCDSVGDGVKELKIYYGPGYRVYFAEDELDIVLLLCGGDKKTQKEDIKKAHEHWKDYRR